MPNILFCGNEDIDFPNGGSISIDTNSSHFRSSYSRNAIASSGGTSTSSRRSLAFPGGAVTSAWLHFYASNESAFNDNLMCGLVNTASGNGSGIYVGARSATSRLGIAKFDGTSVTWLAAAGDNVLGGGGAVDMHIQNFGASAQIDVYYNGNTTADVSYSGSTTISGVSNLDAVAVCCSGSFDHLSEFIVSDSDTRAMSLVTLAPSGAGDSSGSWTNSYTSINPVTINDANAIYNNATGSDFQCNLTDLPSGSFSVLAVKLSARAEVTAGATPTGFKLGIKSGGTVNVDSGHTPGAAFQLFERYMATNPVTSAAWTSSDVNALQLDVQSA